MLHLLKKHAELRCAENNGIYHQNNRRFISQKCRPKEYPRNIKYSLTAEYKILSKAS
jgi:hypothetical protein